MNATHLPAALIGNGSLLATLSASGRLEKLFWPRIDWGQHLGDLRLAVLVDGEKRWLDEPPFAHRQEYVEGTTALRTTALAEGLEVEITDVVLPETPVLTRHVRLPSEAEALLVHVRPEFDESPRYGGAYVDPDTGSLVLYRRGTVIALGLVPRGEAECVAHGAVEGTLTCELDGEALLGCAFGSSPDEALARLLRSLVQRPARLLSERILHDQARLNAATEPLEDLDGVAPLYRRSLLVFDLVSDRSTGAVIAAPEADPDFRLSGGYGFVWGRDLAYSALAFLAAGHVDLAARALRWSTTTQSSEGLWLQRHCVDGALAPSWALNQLDQTGTLLFAFEAAFRELSDEVLDRDLWPAARRAADFLVRFRDESGLPRASYDLWEECEAQHAYTAASVAGGLRAAAAMAERHAPTAANRYAVAAEEVAHALERRLFDPETGRFARSRVAAQRGGVELDPTVDASLLGLAWPFAAVPADSPRMRATVAAIERTLTARCGGIRRYEGDRYAGGNAWVLTTLWLGLWHRRVGNEEGYRRCLDFAVGAQTDLGLLPEQVAEDGRPAWVVPLTWSHAMLVLAARPELAAVRDAGARRAAVA